MQIDREDFTFIRVSNALLTTLSGYLISITREYRALHSLLGFSEGHSILCPYVEVVNRGL